MAAIKAAGIENVGMVTQEPEAAADKSDKHDRGKPSP
jgi:hypothetical protein